MKYVCKGSKNNSKHKRGIEKKILASLSGGGNNDIAAKGRGDCVEKNAERSHFGKINGKKELFFYIMAFLSETFCIFVA